ncbi:DUF1634 domain-containing protein [Vulcanisaeta distributa]|uniref:DUF1634 domain-containing protein n=1 Tax=Vulcanisaeta distributa (strain DSM 14429 / JCM 11212 / NBRC 100878 / IC-017) TaxID=572478 RepID=E1QV89_VULDI|nr:DUF1634 domain-containing protein [Vulcanisaeta distributa]ADN50016.1 protein of unknown function DUF1634 [Vulcanisaeta distributa DSM 14429]
MPRWDMDYVIGLTLRYGVIISIALILIGIALFHVKGEALGCSETLVMSPTSPINTTVIPPAYALSRLPNLDPLSFIILGLMVLIATPVLRVALGIASFAMEKDWLYVFITAVVFMNLMLAIFILPSIMHLHANAQLLKLLCPSSNNP